MRFAPNYTSFLGNTMQSLKPTHTFLTRALLLCLNRSYRRRWIPISPTYCPSTYIASHYSSQTQRRASFSKRNWRRWTHAGIDWENHWRIGEQHCRMLWCSVRYIHRQHLHLHDCPFGQLILLFSKDALYWSKVTIKTFVMLQETSISNKCCFLYFIFFKVSLFPEK